MSKLSFDNTRNSLQEAQKDYTQEKNKYFASDVAVNFWDKYFATEIKIK